MADGAPDAWDLRKADSQKVYKALPLATLQQWILEGRVDPEDTVRAKGTKDWAAVGDVRELGRYFAPQSMGADMVSSADMSNLFSRSRESGDAGVDLTPFIDVTFLLLIFFVVTAQFQHQSIKVDPPSAKNTQSRKQEKLVVSISKDGRVFLSNKEVAIRNLARAIADEMQRTLQTSVVIAGDKASNLEVFVKVLDQCKEAKAKRVFVRAIPPRE